MVDGTVSQSDDPLDDILKESMQVRELVEECSSELSKVNADMQRSIESSPPQAGTNEALSKNRAVERKVAHVAEKIDTVNGNLTGQVGDRHVLKNELSAAVIRESAATQLALHDVLTGLPNRALLDDRLEHGLALANRHGWGMAVLFIDLNAFKQVNDSRGHATGDRLLKSFARRLRENTRNDDTVSRYGGDEFVYLLMNTKTERDVAGFAEMLISTLSQPYGSSDEPIGMDLTIGVSIGISLFPQNGRSADILMKLAGCRTFRPWYGR